MEIKVCKCGSTPEVVKIFPKNRQDCFVRCPECGSETKCYTSRQNAVKAWNDGRLYMRETEKIVELLRDRAMVGRMAVRDKQLMLEAADRLEKIENESWDAGFNAAITEGGYRDPAKVAVETIMDFETRMEVHFGTYTKEDVVKVSDVFKLVNRIVIEMLE